MPQRRTKVGVHASRKLLHSSDATGSASTSRGRPCIDGVDERRVGVARIDRSNASGLETVYGVFGRLPSSRPCSHRHHRSRPADAFSLPPIGESISDNDLDVTGVGRRDDRVCLGTSGPSTTNRRATRSALAAIGADQFDTERIGAPAATLGGARVVGRDDVVPATEHRGHGRFTRIREAEHDSVWTIGHHPTGACDVGEVGDEDPDTTRHRSRRSARSG